LSRELAASAAQDRTSTATLLAHLAEFDARRLYLPAAYPSMHAYCVHELHLSEDSAFKRIRVARTAREYPAVFTAVADGRLHLTAVVLLGPHLTPETADELLAAAAHKSKPEIEQLIAQRLPRQEEPAGVLALSSAGPSTEQLVPEPVGSITTKLAPEAVGASASRPFAETAAQPRESLQLMVIPGTRDKLRYAGSLMSHQIPSGDLAEVLDRILDLGIRQLEKRKFAATTKPSRKQRTTTSARHIPAPVKRAVWERDQGQCTFVSECGRRCPARMLLETIWNDGPAVVGSCHLREERPTAVA
jgi:hypothetical protein